MGGTHGWKEEEKKKKKKLSPIYWQGKKDQVST
jgi:hypothetical protein